MKAANTLILALVCFSCLACGGGGGAAPPSHGLDQNGSGAMTVSVSVSGMALRPLPKSAGAGIYSVHIVPVKEATRRIDPGDIPSDIDAGSLSLLATGQWLVGGLATNQNVLVQVVMSPAMDLATGLPVTSRSAYQPSVMVPVYVPAGSAPNLRLAINFAPNPAGGYFIDSSLLAANAAEPDVVARVDYLAGTVARDSNGDHDFSGEVALPDPDKSGISPQLLARLDAENELPRPPAASTYSATLLSADTAAGVLRVHGLQGAGLPESGEVTVRFAEDTAFVSRLVGLSGTTLTRLQPDRLLAGTRLALQGRLFPTGPAGQTELWLTRAEKLDLLLPADSIAAVPLVASARPGKVVPVSVYVNRTAHPLHAVSRLRVSFDAANRFLPGSLDPGESSPWPDLADGAWAGSSAAPIWPGNTQVVSGQLSATRSYVDIALQPAGGLELDSATGALCTFSLICNTSTALAVEPLADDGAATVYAGGDGAPQQWAHCLAGSQPQVMVSGTPLVLALSSLPAQGAGTLSDPFVVAPGVVLQFRLLDPIGGDVTLSPRSTFTLTYGGVAPFDITGGICPVPITYHGPLHISARYGNIFCQPASELECYIQ